MNYLFFSDIHLEKNSIKECSGIFDEIVSICDTYKIDKVFNAGDTFDSLHPTSEEFDLFANFIKKLNRPMIVISADSHESSSHSISITNHFGILSETVSIAKQYIEESKLFVGHFIVNESNKNRGGSVSKQDLAQYKYVVLGHGHRPEMINPNICQLGSSRYIDFAESEDVAKHTLIIQNYGNNDEKCLFLPLKSVYPMQDLVFQKKVKTQGESTSKTRSFKALSGLLGHLDKMVENTKVRVIFKDFEGWLAFRPYYDKYSDKFILFKDKKEFDIMESLTPKSNEKNNTIEESLKKYLQNNNIDLKIQEVLLKEIE